MLKQYSKEFIRDYLVEFLKELLKQLSIVVEILLVLGKLVLLKGFVWSLALSNDRVSNQLTVGSSNFTENSKFVSYQDCDLKHPWEDSLEHL